MILLRLAGMSLVGELTEIAADVSRSSGFSHPYRLPVAFIQRTIDELDAMSSFHECTGGLTRGQAHADRNSMAASFSYRSLKDFSKVAKVGKLAATCSRQMCDSLKRFRITAEPRRLGS